MKTRFRELEKNVDLNFRYEFAIEMVLKNIPMAYRIVQMDHVDFKYFIAKYILHQLATSGEQW